MHRAGFVNIIGKPNVGKSTLMNLLLGEKMSITNAKPQTTRHRILGILSGEDYQIVFSDSPGIISNPSYKMQEAMNKFAYSSFADADVLILMIDASNPEQLDDRLIQKISHLEVPKILIINKIDLATKEKSEEIFKEWNSQLIFSTSFYISALKKAGTEEILPFLLENLPECPAYFPKEQLSDRPERFFVTEIIREKILELYHQEIPYSVELVVEQFKEIKTENKEFIHLYVVIFVERKTQKSIIIGKNGASIKKLGTLARKQLEEFLDSKVFLELYVKVKEDWRNNEFYMKKFGYQN